MNSNDSFLHSGPFTSDAMSRAFDDDEYISERDQLDSSRTLAKGVLAPWQAKRVRSYIEGRLDSKIRATDLAGIVRLSTSYFFRAFRRTFGDTPVAYIMKRRMLRAQELMLKSRVPLSQVALECGMFDQAHFSRTFRRIVGTNPTVWRRRLLVSRNDMPPA